VKVTLEQARVPKDGKLDSFSLSMSVLVSNQVSNLQQDITFFQVGINAMNKILTLGITRDQVFFVSIMYPDTS
jgi:hypothetical protein